MFAPGPSYFSKVASAQAQADANDAQASAREATTEVELLQHEVGRLSLITEALWTLLKKQNGYSDEDLITLVQEIDLRDGKGAKASASPCPNCGRVNSNKYSRCIYCGSALPVKLFPQ